MEMNSEQVLSRLVGQIERLVHRRTWDREFSPEPRQVVDEYFLDRWRPRLSGNAFMVWVYLCLRAEPDSRIAGVSYRDLRSCTGIRSNRGLRRAIAELARFGYCLPGHEATGPGLPRNYKIPEHIGSSALPPPEAQRLFALADRPRKPGSTSRLSAGDGPNHGAPAGPPKPCRRREYNWYENLDLKAFARPDGIPPSDHPPENGGASGQPRISAGDGRISPTDRLPAGITPGAPAGPLFPAMDQGSDLNLKSLENMDLDKEIARLEKEVEEIGKALGKE